MLSRRERNAPPEEVFIVHYEAENCIEVNGVSLHYAVVGQGTQTELLADYGLDGPGIAARLMQ